MKNNFGSIFFHRLKEKRDMPQEEVDEMIEKMSGVLAEYGFQFDQYEFLGLPCEEFPIDDCSRCGLLVAGFPLTDITNESPVELNITQYLKQGSSDQSKVICNECKIT